MKLRSNHLIPATEVKKMLLFLHDLHDLKSAEVFGDRVVELMCNFMPNAQSVFEELDLRSGAFHQVNNFKIGEASELKFYEMVRAYYAQKPIARYLDSGGQENVIRNSDIMTPRALSKTDICHYVLQPLECVNQLYLLVPFAGKDVRLILSRDRDFTDETVEIFRLLSDHVRLAYRNAQIQSDLRKAHVLDTKKQGMSTLTPRESEVLHWVHEGKRNSEISTILRISPRTVEKHVESILRKLKVETRTSAAFYAKGPASTEGT